ncbi:MAG: transposase [Terriglobia bacterium]
MKRKKHTPQQIVEKLCTVEAELGQGGEIAEVARKLEVSEQTLYRWRHQYGGIKGPEVARLKDLERENARLKKIVAEQAMDIDVLKEIGRKNW